MRTNNSEIYAVTHALWAKVVSRETSARTHLADPVVELLEAVVVDTQESLRRALLRHFILQVPHAVSVAELFKCRADLGQETQLKPAHVYEHVRVVLRVDGSKAAVPLDRRERPRQTVLDVPKHGATEVDVVLHQPHARIARPALLVVVPARV